MNNLVQKFYTGKKDISLGETPSPPAIKISSPEDRLGAIDYFTSEKLTIGGAAGGGGSSLNNGFNTSMTDSSTASIDHLAGIDEDIDGDDGKFKQALKDIGELVFAFKGINFDIDRLNNGTSNETVVASSQNQQELLGMTNGDGSDRSGSSELIVDHELMFMMDSNKNINNIYDKNHNAGSGNTKNDPHINDSAEIEEKNSLVVPSYKVQPVKPSQGRPHQLFPRKYSDFLKEKKKNKERYDNLLFYNVLDGKSPSGKAGNFSSVGDRMLELGNLVTDIALQVASRDMELRTMYENFQSYKSSLVTLNEFLIQFKKLLVSKIQKANAAANSRIIQGNDDDGDKGLVHDDKSPEDLQDYLRDVVILEGYLDKLKLNVENSSNILRDIETKLDESLKDQRASEIAIERRNKVIVLYLLSGLLIIFCVWYARKELKMVT
ncbi:hypothetical protein DASC09_005980 [Saccharomycopsis crataegensis]|uniref:t-SNARE coiled-coil homology domain-containing protein n=1 Tax=Saccharomycopsis crataegensis TaxID=43959 RepID=A0AAV5QEL1_9ASCO|nr:hypothetical protein DASC09_005980 [Saccharomycopsis crataegensis]